MLIIEILYTVSALIQVLQFYLSGPYAEDFRDFLLRLLQNVWGLNKHMQVGGPYLFSQFSDNNFNGKGMYFIFGYTDNKYNPFNQHHVYPLYIGITGVKFKKRFSKHTKKWLKETMIFNWLNGGNTGTVKLKPIAYLVNMPLPVAKFFESVFLSAFDFPVNKEENNGARKTINTQESKPFEDGRTHFLLNLKPIFSDLVNAVKLI